MDNLFRYHPLINHIMFSLIAGTVKDIRLIIFVERTLRSAYLLPTSHG